MNWVHFGLSSDQTSLWTTNNVWLIQWLWSNVNIRDEELIYPGIYEEEMKKFRNLKDLVEEISEKYKKLWRY